MPRIKVREGSPVECSLTDEKLPKKDGFIRKHSKKQASKRSIRKGGKR